MPIPVRFKALITLAFFTLTTVASVQSARAGPADLQSAAGDRVILHARFHAPCPDPATGCGPVRVCLHNPATNRGAKGLGLHRGAAPDLIAAPGQRRCTGMANVVQRITLFAGPDGTVPVMVTPLDLRHKLGFEMVFFWTTEAPLPDQKEPPT